MLKSILKNCEQISFWKQYNKKIIIILNLFFYFQKLVLSNYTILYLITTFKIYFKLFKRKKTTIFNSKITA